VTQPALGSPPLADPVVASRCKHVRWVAQEPIYTCRRRKLNCHFRERRETRTREVPKGPEDDETDLYPSRSATARREHHDGTPMRGCRRRKSAEAPWHLRAPRDKTPQGSTRARPVFWVNQAVLHTLLWNTDSMVHCQDIREDAVGIGVPCGENHVDEVPWNDLTKWCNHGVPRELA